MSSQRDGGTADAEQSELQSEENEGQKSSLVDDLLKDAREMGHVIGEPLRTKTEVAEPVAQDEGEVTAEDETQDGDSETDPGDATDEAIDEEEDKTVEDESEEEAEELGDTKIEKQIASLKAEGKEVPWYLSRIAKNTRQKNEWKTAAEKTSTLALELKQRAEDAEAKLAEVEDSGQRPATASTLANVFSMRDLQERKDAAERNVAWCERNRNGGDIVIGKNKDGSEITEYLSEEQVTNLKLGCDKELREGIPQRAAFLNETAKYNQQAVEIYPVYKKREDPFTKEAVEIATALRQGFLPPDLMIWIGHAIKGRNEYVESVNGKNGKDSTSKIVKSAKTKIAPTATKTRGVVPRARSADTDTARKNLQQKGDAESAEQLLERLGIGGGKSRQRVELIEK